MIDISCLQNIGKTEKLELLSLKEYLRKEDKLSVM